MQPEESEEEEEASDEEQASDFEAEELGGKKGGKKAARGSAAKRGRKAAAVSEMEGMGWGAARAGYGAGASCTAAAAWFGSCCRLLCNTCCAMPTCQPITSLSDCCRRWTALCRTRMRRALLLRRRAVLHRWTRTSRQQRTPPARWGGMMYCVAVSAAATVGGSGVQAAALDTRPRRAARQAGGLVCAAGGAGCTARRRGKFLSGPVSPPKQVPADELRSEVEGILGGMAAAELRAITAKPILKQLGACCAALRCGALCCAAQLGSVFMHRPNLTQRVSQQCTSPACLHQPLAAPSCPAEAKYGFSLRPRKQEVVELAHVSRSCAAACLF